MEGTAPVLTERSEIKMWKRINDLKDGAVRKTERNRSKLENIIKEVEASKTDVNPGILSALIDAADHYFSDNIQSIVLSLLGKCKISDCCLQLKAARILVDNGSYDNARSILDRITEISDITGWEYLMGVIDEHEGHTASALEHYRRSYNFDHNCLQNYSALERLEPDNGWKYRQNIMLVHTGRTVESAESLSNCPLGELVQLYSLCNTGGVKSALDSLEHIDGYDAGDKDVLLAAARISVLDGNYPAAIDYYKRIADSPCDSYSVMLELADLYLRSESFEEAKDVFMSLKNVNAYDRRLMELGIRVFVSTEDKKELQAYAESFLKRDYADRNAYSLCIESMIALSLHTEAGALLSKMSVMDRDSPDVLVLSSKNDFKAGRLPQALSSAVKANRKMPDDVSVSIHLATVYLAQKNLKRARKTVDAALKNSPNDLGCLIIKKDICRADGNLNEVIGVCDAILAIDPRNVDVIRDYAMVLDELGRHDESLGKFSEALEIREDRALFVKIITTLASRENYSDAINMISRYDDMYGDIPDTWIIKGNCEYSIGRYHDASDSYQRALDIDHNNHKVWHSKGMAEEAAFLYDEAEVSYDRAVLLDLDNQDYWISKAVVQERKGELAQAIDSFNRVISIHPDNVYALMRKAMLLVALGKITEALFFIDLAYNLEPNNHRILAVKRDIYYHEKEYAKCTDLCKRMIRSKPDDVDSRIVYSRILIEQNDYDKALNHLSEAHRLRSSDIVVLDLMRETYNLSGDNEAEMSTCKVILDLDPDNKEAKMALADVCMKVGRVDAANRYYSELYELSPNDTELTLKKAQITVDENMATQVLLDSLAHDPDNVSILMALVEIKKEDGNTEEVLKYLDRAIEADPTDSAPVIKKAEVLFSQRDYAGALVLLNNSIRTFKEPDPVIWMMIGDAHSKLGDNSNALIAYDSAIKLGLNNADMYCRRGAIQEELGMTDAALNSYTIAHLNDPQNVTSVEHIVGIHMSSGKYDQVNTELRKYIAEGMVTGPLLLIKARLCAMNSDKKELEKTYDMCVSHDISDEYTGQVHKLMESMDPITEQPGVPVDPDGEHSDLNELEEPVPETIEETEDQHRQRIVRYAYEILRVSNETDLPLADPDLHIKSGVPSECIDEVLTYLSDIKEYGDIEVGSSEFRRMEELSVKAVLGCYKKNIESEPLIPLATAYFQSGAGSIEEAKALVAYIYKVVNTDFTPEYFSNEISRVVKAIEESSGDVTVYSVMKTFNIGIYSAKTVKMLSVKNGPSVVDHI